MRARKDSTLRCARSCVYISGTRTHFVPFVPAGCIKSQAYERARRSDDEMLIFGLRRCFTPLCVRSRRAQLHARRKKKTRSGSSKDSRQSILNFKRVIGARPGFPTTSRRGRLPSPPPPPRSLFFPPIEISTTLDYYLDA